MLVPVMISLELVNAFARYNRWMNEKLYALCAQLSDEERKQDRGAFFKSIHRTLNHILLADRVWLSRFQGATVPNGFMAPGGIRSLDQELYTDFQELCRERERTDGELSDWISALNEERLAAPLTYVRHGQKIHSPLYFAVAHVFNHQTHHRGQVTTLLTQYGHDPGVTDFWAMLREEEARTV
jgi:uncharacterized damage-inducible protein DinB